jgi:hypothetical protein
MAWGTARSLLERSNRHHKDPGRSLPSDCGSPRLRMCMLQAPLRCSLAGVALPEGVPQVGSRLGGALPVGHVQGVCTAVGFSNGGLLACVSSGVEATLL